MACTTDSNECAGHSVRLSAYISEALSRKRSLQRGSLRSFEGLKRGAFLVDVVVVQLGVCDASPLSADAVPAVPKH